MKRLITASFAFFLFLSLVTPVRAAPVNINSIVYGPPPAAPPTIDEPVNNQLFTKSLITVKGTCVTGLTVRVFKNSVFGGSSICDGSGNYSMQTDLFVGRDDLVARQYDGLNQPSPDSNLVTTFYNPPPQPVPPSQKASPPTAAISQLILGCDYSANKAFVDQPFKLPCQIAGGIAPYAISIDWGDGETGVVAQDTSGNFVIEHTYKSAGNYLVKIKGSDKNNSNAYLQMSVIVSGKQDLFSKLTEPLYQCKPDILWPLLLLLLLILLILITSYKFGKREGEREELEELRRLHRLKPPRK